MIKNKITAEFRTQDNLLTTRRFPAVSSGSSLKFSDLYIPSLPNLDQFPKCCEYENIGPT